MSFSWGLRLLVGLDGFFLYSSLMLPMDPWLRLSSFALLWGPWAGFSGAVTFRRHPTLAYIAYHGLSVLVGLFLTTDRDGTSFLLQTMPSFFHAWELTLVYRFYRLISGLSDLERLRLRGSAHGFVLVGTRPFPEYAPLLHQMPTRSGQANPLTV